MIHSTGKKFFNPWAGSEPHGLGGVLRWTFERLGKKRRRGVPPVVSVARRTFHTKSDEVLQVTWIGHSTFLIQVGGRNILTDPIWSDRASPVQFAGPRRISPPGVAIEDLPLIHAVLISHDHYDHLDTSTVSKLRRMYPEARWFAPVGVGSWLRKRGVADVVEQDWDESSEWGESTITCIPAQHFSGRSISGRDKTLWCGWIVRSSGNAVLFAGDTGLHPDFERLTRTYGPVSVAIIPIGAYDPRWFMRPVHMNPEDAVAAYIAIRNVNADNRCVLIPSHWGTFLLTDEPADEPPERLREAWGRAQLPSENCAILHLGESHSYHP